MSISDDKAILDEVIRQLKPENAQYSDLPSAHPEIYWYQLHLSMPDVDIVWKAGSGEVVISCRRHKFHSTHAHLDVDDIMTVISGWMKEAGSKCNKPALMTPTKESEAFEGMFPPEPSIHLRRYNEIFTKCGVKPGPGNPTTEDPVDMTCPACRKAFNAMIRPLPDQKVREREAEEDEVREANERAAALKAKRRGWGVDKPPPQHPATLRGYHTTSGNPYCIVTRGTGGTEEHWLHTLADAQWMVREAKTDSRISHIELTDHRPGGKEWYYDRDRSGFWKRTVHN